MPVAGRRGARSNNSAGFWDAKPAEHDGPAASAPPARAAQRASHTSAAPAGEPISEYELQRLNTIRRNEERMREIGLTSAAAAFAATVAPPATARPKGLSTKRKRSGPAGPRRESLRVQGKAPDGTQVYSERQGEIVLISGEAVLFRTEPPEPRDRHDTSPELPFKSDAHSASSSGAASEERGGGAAVGSDEEFLRLLRRLDAGGGGGSSTPGQRGGRRGAASAGSKAAAGGLPTGRQLAGLALQDDDVAKVTRAGVVHLAFHPTAHTLLLAAADKAGGVGLWHVDHEPPADPEEEGEGDGPLVDAEPAATEGAALEATPAGGARGSDAFEGVSSFVLHRQYVSGLRWVGGSTGGDACQLYTASYDGSVRALDPGGGCFRLLHSDKEAEFSAMDATADGRLVLLADTDYGLHFIDIRSKAPAVKGPAEAHSRKINTVHVEPGAEQYFASSSTDSQIKVWDLRTLGPKMAPALQGAHAASCQAAYFSPDGSRRLVSTSFDDTVRLWDAAGSSGLTQLVSARHNNNTGRYIMPFRAVWGPACDAVIVGNMQRGADILDASGGKALGVLRGEALTAIPARNAAHPALPAVAAATASGRVHVFR